jgi:glutathione S-transferase
MKLYYARYTRAHRPRWLLEEAGAAYELVRIDLRSGGHKQADYLAVHPHGVVPALELDDGQIVYESGAIVMYLADQLGLAPAIASSERGAYCQWVAYCLATVEPLIQTYARHTRFLPEELRSAPTAEDAKGQLRQVWQNLSRALESRTTLLDAFSAADILLVSMASWAKSFGLIDEQPVIQRYLQTHTARPAHKRAAAD